MQHDVKQNTEKWHHMRSSKLGASDIPVVLGLSKYKTALQLWEEKTGQVPREELDAFAGRYAQRGHDLEPIAREKVITLLDMDFVPTVFTKRYLMASLDGWNADAKVVLEIKCPGKEDHAIALSGKVPEHYYPQMQAQMYVSDALLGYYYSFDGVNGVLISVDRDYKFFDGVMKDIDFFWSCVQSGIPPEPTTKDWVKTRDVGLVSLVNEYTEIKYRDAVLQKKLKQLKSDIEGRLTHPRTIVGEVKIQKIYRKGNVQYKNVPELKNVDLEPYRAKTTTYYTIN